MSRLTGLAITGLAIYLAVNSLPDYNSREDHVAAVTIATDNREGLVRDFNAASEAPRSFSPANPLLTQLARELPVKKAATARTATVGVLETNPAQPVINEKISGENVQLALTNTATGLQAGMLKTAVVNTPRPEDILRETQRELKRVGCYKSRVDGIWGKGSRRALRKFVRGSDALDPNLATARVSRPNMTLLEILRKTSTRICGQPCGSNEMLAPNGRCVSDPVIMAKLTSGQTWAAIVQPTPLPDVQSRKIAKRAAARKKALKRRRRLASRKWRAKRYSLGGPVYYSKRAAKRKRHARKYRYARRRDSSWKRQILSPEY